MIDRDKMINEIQEEKRLRQLIRKDLKRFLENKNKEALQEKKTEDRLRVIVRQLIAEASKTDVPDAQPHQNTGINVLEDLLRNIIPIVEDGYKALTSASEQRTSFRSHILNAIQNTLKPVEVVADLDTEEAEASLEEQDLTINVEDEGEDKFIPVRDVDMEDDEPEEEEDTFTIAGEDLTGRNFASITFNKVEKQIIDAFESLANEADRNLFYDYLLTNLKLYFDKFEEELQVTSDEPESPDYGDEPLDVDEPENLEI
jgi:hypothetical protein|tara:strand:+ start:505 stop:1278 length:774 start_codon:yes stop_codon:yes gene_type:complete